jgi:thioredoxin-related protein
MFAIMWLAVLMLPVAATLAGAQDAPTAIAWQSYQEGLVQAKELDKPVLINFTAGWCKYCRKMKQETYTDLAVIAYVSEHFVPVMVDTEKERRIAAEYFVRGLPTIWFLTGEGQRITNLPGFVDAPMFLNVLSYISTGSYLTMEFKPYLDSLPAEP